MGFEISRRAVLDNLLRFKEIVTEKGRDAHQEQRVYRVLLNRKTGDMRFAKKISALQIERKGVKRESPEDWKQIQIIVHQKSSREPAHFEVRDAQDHSLSTSDLEPLAWKIANETIKVLNLKAEDLTGRHTEMLAEEAILNDLSSIPVSTASKERMEDQPGWRDSVGREGAEHLLDGRPVGTYLLREGDPLTVATSFHFANENHLEIHPYVMTVVEREGKISDILILQTSKGWTLYYDDPNLNDQVLYEFSSLKAILHHLSPIARSPLPMDRASE